MTRNRIVAVFATVVVVIGLLAVRQQRVVQRDRAPLLSEPATAVQVVPVRRGTLESVDHVLGEVHGNDDADVAPQVSGQVTAVLVREGTPVAEGTILARLDSRELADAVGAGQADVEAARAAYEAQAAASTRDSVLFVNEAIATEQWQASRAVRAASAARLEVARRRMNQAQVRLSYTVVRAPFPGVVSARMADPGDLAIPGKPLLRVLRQSAVRVRGLVSPAVLAHLLPGTRADLTLDDVRVEAAVSRVFPAMQGSHLGTFEIDLARPAAGFVAGATVGVDLHLRTGSGTLVPLDALLEGPAGSYAFVTEPTGVGFGTVRIVPLTVTSRSLDEAVVEGNLRVGQQVVVARPSRLMDLAAGMRVQLASAPAVR